MIALAVLVTQIALDSATGKTDAGISAGLRTATNLFEAERAAAKVAARKAATEIAADPGSIAALEQADASTLAPLAGSVQSREDLAWAEITDSAGNTVEAGARGAPVAAATVDLRAPSGAKVGSVSVSTITAAEMLERIESTTGEMAALVGPRGSVAGAVSIEAETLPESGEAADLDADGQELRIAATDPLGDEGTRVAVLAAPADQGFLTSRPTLAIALLVFLLVALAAIAFIVRTLRGQVKEMLEAARRLGEGDFSGRVPVRGDDEIAGLATEFNKMSDRLGEQMDQLRRQRTEIERSVRRIGEAFSAGLNRQALLTVLVEATVGACEAEYGLIALSGHVGAQAEWGVAAPAVGEVALSAEARAMREPGLIEHEHDGAYALSSALGTVASSHERVGALTVARPDRAFDSNERAVFLYLLGQAASSVENVSLHELVSQQAVTDDLTGLANKRAFREVMNKETARAARYGHPLSLVIADIDDFKHVNDTLGHLQGDAVLRAVGAILADESRGIDVAARYGGEEFVIALPETTIAGALEVAERVRTRIETEVTVADGTGAVEVTASLGVATGTGRSLDTDELIASADAALYEAKVAGKNRVVVATDRAPSGVGRKGRITDKGRASLRRK